VRKKLKGSASFYEEEEIDHLLLLLTPSIAPMVMLKLDMYVLWRRLVRINEYRASYHLSAPVLRFVYNCDVCVCVCVCVCMCVCVCVCVCV